jgi:hypothetical protein
LEHKEAKTFFEAVGLIKASDDFDSFTSNDFNMEAVLQLLFLNASQDIQTSINPTFFSPKPSDNKLLCDFDLILKCKCLKDMENFNRNVLNNAMSKFEVDYYFKNIRKYTKEKFRNIRNTLVTILVWMGPMI